MDVIIDAACEFTPTGLDSVVSDRTALLHLLSCLGYDPADPPLAGLLSKYHGLEGDWLILSPVHWQATHNDALIVAAGKELNLSEAEARSWFALFANYLAAENRLMHYHEPNIWLLQDDQQHPLRAKPVSQLIGKSLMPELAQLDSTLFWQKFITESQMLFASLPNQSLVNGLWPWGNAALIKNDTKRICTDASFFSLAQSCSNQVTLYSPEIKLGEQDILLISNLSVLSEPHQKELEKTEVHWYWNNTVYTRNKCNWVIRLWRKLIHAH